MKYTIKQIMPTQIAVKFEDGSKAVLYISPEATPEEIDDAVSYYDPDFRPDPETLINKNISVGEERVSIRKEEQKLKEPPDVELPPIEVSLDGSLPKPKFSKELILINYMMADYFIKKYNDNTLKLELEKKIEEYIVSNNITSEQAVNSLLFEDDDFIVKLAMQELENE